MRTFRFTIVLVALAAIGALLWFVQRHEPTSLVVFLLRIALLLVPFVSLARWPRVYPNELLVALMALPALVTLGAAWSSGFVWAAAVLDGALLLVALYDLTTLPSRASITLQREAGRVASLHKDHPVVITLTYRGHRACRLKLRDGVPTKLEALPEEFPLLVSPMSRTIVEYKLRPHRRGAFELAQISLRAYSLLGLWQRLIDYPVKTTLHVYPDLIQLEEYALLARTNRLNLMGLRRSRLVGQDNEFERLRDYTSDDNYKHIDWRSTARRNRLTVRDFQANHNQRVIFLIDCGRMMTNEAAGLSLLDHALNSMLMLSYVALSRGDAVGLMLFSDEIHAYVPPEGGKKQMNRLLHAGFDRFPRLVESRYDDAFLHLGAHCRKRALVVLVTNVIDEVNANQVSRHLGALAGRHLPLGVLLRDRRIYAALDDADQEEGLYRAAAAADILTWRHELLTGLVGKGVLSIDVFPEDLTAPLVNRYLDVKARHLL